MRSMFRQEDLEGHLSLVQSETPDLWDRALGFETPLISAPTSHKPIFQTAL